MHRHYFITHSLSHFQNSDGQNYCIAVRGCSTKTYMYIPTKMQLLEKNSQYLELLKHTCKITKFQKILLM